MPLDEGIWIVGDDGKQEWMTYDDLDAEVIPQLFRPIGGFCYPGEQFKRLPLPSVPFYIQDWLPKPGKAILYGRGKAGKSTLALQLARCIGVGEPFLEIPTEQGRTLYLQFEIGAAILQGRMRLTGKAYTNVFVGTSFSMKLDGKSGFEQLVRAVDAIKPNVIILDPFYKLFTGEEKESHDVLTVFDNVDKVIESYDCSVVIFHHGGKDLERGARGSSIFEDYPDAYVEVKSMEGGNKIRLTPKLLRHAELPPHPITAVWDKHEFRAIEPELTIKEKIAQWLESNKRTNMDELLLAEFGSKRAIYAALAELTREGKIVKVDKKDYILSPQIEGNDA